MQAISRQKGHTLFHEGDLTKWLYLIRKGEVQIHKRVKIKQAKGEAGNEKELLEDPATGRKKQQIMQNDANFETKTHFLFTAQKGVILGLEDIVISLTDQYQTTAICSSDQVEFYKIDKDLFINTLKQSQVWPDLVQKAVEQV